MGNIRKWLEESVTEFGEPLESVVVGRHYQVRHDGDPLPDENVLLAPEVALAKLDVEYENGFGAAGCFPIYAWTKSRVFFIGEYDGSTGISWVPRNPIAMPPSFNGEAGS